VPKQLCIRCYRMNLPPLRTLFFEDLSIGMTETLEKTVSSSDVVGFAQLTGAIPSIFPNISQPAPHSASASRTDFTPQA
jgi:hypothetical protein